MTCLATAVHRSRKQRMEPLYCCWGKGGSGEQHQPPVMEMAPVLREEEGRSSGAAVARHGDGEQIQPSAMGVAEESRWRCRSWRWFCRAAG